jgi:hypothetical protein
LRRDLDNQGALAALVALVTGAGFTAVKLFPPANALVAEVWGVMVLDSTDLWALLVLPLSAAFVLRRTAGSSALSASSTPGLTLARTPTPARRALEFAAVFAAAFASAATSKATPPPAVPPQPVAEPVAVVAASPDECASLALSVCERSASATFLVVEARGTGPGSCEIDVEQALELGDGETGADRLPARVVVKEGDTATFSLSFLRSIAPHEQTGSVGLRLSLRRGREALNETPETIELSLACTSR